MTGAEKKILDAIPDLDVNVMADDLSNALLDSSMNQLVQTKAPEPPQTGQLGGLAQEAQEEEQELEGGGEDAGSPSPPATEEEAEEEQDAAAEELTSAVKDAGTENKPPGAAVMDALDAWFDGLSDSSQQTLSAAGRFKDLKSGMTATMDGLADSVEKEIRDAITDWRSSHEESLIKSRRFAKKNFDTLEQTIPQLAAFMVKKVDESTGKLTKQYVRKTVWKLLNKRFSPKTVNVLAESYEESDMQMYRMKKLAGLINE